MGSLDNGGKYRLLAVEDDKDCAELIVRTALRCRYESFPVYDLRELREVISHWRPHVITLDLGLPDAHGLEALSLLRAVQFTGSLIIISGQPEWLRKQAVQMASIGELQVVVDMPKPIHVAELRDLLISIKARLFLSLLNQLGSKRQSSQSAKT